MLGTIIVIGLGLSMDAFSVSVTDGLCGRNVGAKKAALIAFFFGLAQAVMPLIGYFAGSLFSQYISTVDHWIAFVLLGIIGLKMILEAVDHIKSPEQCKQTELSLKTLFFQAIATSIDALAVGISLAALKVNVFLSVLMIGLITFVCSFAGVFIGKKMGGALKEKAEIFGGIILIVIGLKILIEHLFFS